MLQRLRERLVLALIILLPFHAFGVTVLTRVMAGQNHAPLGLLAIWKEALLAVILGIALVEVLMCRRKCQVSGVRCQVLSFDAIDWIIAAAIILGFVISTSYQLPATNYLYGFKYDFLPLIAFLILRIRLPLRWLYQSSHGL
jgi:hypothetical protein